MTAGIKGDIDFGRFVEIVNGSTIVSAAKWDDALELGISEEFNIRFQQDAQGNLSIILISTLNENELPPLRLRIVADREAPTAALVQERIWALRQAYAIALLISTDRADSLAELLNENADADIEATLLEADERLLIQAAGPGSFWLTVATKSRAGFRAASNVFALFSREGREAFLRSVRANAALRELEVEQKRLEIEQKRINGFIDTIAKAEKIKDSRMRETVKAKLTNYIEAVNEEPLGLLPPPPEPLDITP